MSDYHGHTLTQTKTSGARGESSNPGVASDRLYLKIDNMLIYIDLLGDLRDIWSHLSQSTLRRVESSCSGSSLESGGAIYR